MVGRDSDELFLKKKSDSETIRAARSAHFSVKVMTLHFNEVRAELVVQCFLEEKSLVVKLVNRARELDEICPKILLSFPLPKRIFHIPESCVCS